MKRIQDHDRIILVRDLPDLGLQQGDLGTVVMVHGDDQGFEVEFMTLDGRTIAVTTLLSSDFRPIGKNQVSHVRQLES